jgi:hypothetical protein
MYASWGYGVVLFILATADFIPRIALFSHQRHRGPHDFVQ